MKKHWSSVLEEFVAWAGVASTISSSDHRRGSNIFPDMNK